AGGAGAYTLDVTVLPQVVSVRGSSLLPGVAGRPGGPVNSLVVTLQGDGLDPAAAQDPANYRVVLLAPGGDVVIPLSAARGAIYTSQAKVEVASGLTYPKAVQHTVTLFFDQALPAGTYRVELLPALQAAPYNAVEADLLGGDGHLVL